MDLIIWIGGGVAAVLLLIGIVVSLSGDRSLVEERLERYTEAEIAELQDARGALALTDWLDTQVGRAGFGERMARELARADLKFKPGEYVGLILVSCFFMGLIGYALAGEGTLLRLVFAAVGALLIGPAIPRFFLRRAQHRRLGRFNDQLPDMLNLVVNGLRAGYSQIQAMESVSKELPAPISDEFQRVVREIQLGLTVPEALDNLLRRIPSPDLDFIITAINIQRESGGNLSEILDIISYTIRERIRIKREIQVLVSQVLYSGRILAIMPIALAFALWLLNRDYMQQFFIPGNRICGIPMLICGGLMIYLGYLAMNRIAKIEV